ncbi:MAG TPA: SsrA-binding protein SmpB [Anaeromyxobacteraceae bacterium]|nr:SsrA-binding protein SmpB [Anaeromyxobacteraceae bacterium]
MSKKAGGAKGGRSADPGVQVVARNKRAGFDFQIEERLEAGLVLSGSEVKSLRAGNANLADAYARPVAGELFLMNCRIGEYDKAAHFGHAPLRDRKLLLSRAQIDKLSGKVERAGYTLVPTQLYFRDGWAKVELALAKGRSHEDRRDAIAERESKREMDRAMARHRRR